MLMTQLESELVNYDINMFDCLAKMQIFGYHFQSFWLVDFENHP